MNSLYQRLRSVGIFATTLWLSPNLSEAAPGDIDTSFSLNLGSASEVRAISQLPDGGTLIGGYFSQINGSYHTGLAKLRPDGTYDPSFRPVLSGFNNNGAGSVSQIVVDSENRILIAGDFTHINGVPRRDFARLLPDGTVDASFHPTINDEVLSISLQTDGKILIGGEFTWVGGLPIRYLARLQADGQVDAAFNPTLRERTPVTKVCALPDGKVIATNYEFTTASGTVRRGIARFLSDGSLDTTFDTALSSISVNALTVQPDGKIVAGGWFVRASPSVETEIVRFNTDGSLDGSFTCNLEMSGYTDGTYTVLSLALQEDGKIIIGGGFDKINGVSRSRLARVTATGSLDATFASKATQWVHTLAIQPTGRILASQSTFVRLDNTVATESLTFPTASSISWNRSDTSPFAQNVLFEKHTSSGGWEPLGTGTKSATAWTLTGVSLPPQGVIRARAVPSQSGPQSIATQIANPSSAFQILDAAENPLTNNQLLSFPKVFPGTRSELRFTLRNTGNSILKPIAPSFSGTNPADFSITPFPGEPLCPGESRTFVIRFSPSTLNTKNAVLTLTPSQSGLTSRQFQLSGTAAATLQPTLNSTTRTTVIADGFTTAGNTVGQITLGFHPSKGTILKLIDNRAIDHDNFATGHPIPLPISGTFPDLPDDSMVELAFGGETYRFGVSYKGGDGNDLTLTLLGAGTIDPTFNLRSESSPGSPLQLRHTSFLPDGRMVVSGGVSDRSLARIKPDGTIDHSFNFRGTFTFHAICVQDDGKVLIAGGSPDYAIGSGFVLARLNADGSLDKVLTRDINNQITSIRIRPDGNVLLTGLFTSIAGYSRQGLALLDSEGGVITSFNAQLNGNVGRVALQADGKMIILGQFTSVGSNARGKLARLNADGTFDPSFAPTFVSEHWNGSPSYQDVLVQPDQKIVIGGTFHKVNGVSRHGIVRFNPDGSVDESFDAKPDDEVTSMFLLQDGGILATGFRSAGGIHGEAARFLPDGTADPSFALPYNGLPAPIAGVMPTGDILLENGQRILGDKEQATLQIQPGPSVVWLRPDHAGNVSTPRFEQRTGGAGNWTSLGQPERIAGGWKVTVSSLPSIGAIRVTGHGSNGAEAGSADQTYLALGSDSPSIVIRKTDGSSASVSDPIPFGSTIPQTSIHLDVAIENTSASWIHGVSATIASSPDFALLGLSDDSIPPFGSIVARVKFTPQSSGAKAASLNVQSTSGVSTTANVQGEGGTVFSRVIASRYPTEVYTDFNLSGYSLGHLTLEFPPNVGQAITPIQSSGNQPLGEFTNVPDGSAIRAYYKGHPFRLIVNYVNSGFRTVTLTPATIISGISPFNASLGSATATAMAIQRDGKIIVSGNFEQAGGSPHGKIARLHPDGTVDHTFSPSFSHAPDSIAIQADGRILLAGTFTTVNGTNRRGIARLHPDGTLDGTFDLGLTGDALRVVVQEDDLIYVTGPFLTIGGTPRPGIVRLLSNGSVDTTFTAALSTTVTSQPQAIQPLPDGKTLIGGTLRLADGTLVYLRRLLSDGTLDSSFTSSPNASVIAIALQKDLKIIVGGTFTAIDGRGHGRIARLLSDGSVDKTFHSNLTANNTISGLAIQSNGAVLMAGQFTQVTSLNQRAVGRLLSTGEPDTGFLTSTTSSIIRAVALTETGEVLAAGDFSGFNGTGRNGLVKIPVESGTSSFEASGDQVTWSRTGSLPEFTSAIVEHSQDGGTWTLLGKATAHSNQWKLEGTSLPTGFIRARGLHAVSNRSSGASQAVRLTGRGPTAIENWRQTAFGSPLNEGVGADTGDADADGSKNLVEYAFNLNPSDPASRLTADWTRTGDHHEISLPLPVGITGLNYDAEWSTSMKPDEWYPAEDMRDPETLRFRVFSADKPNLFLRLKVVRP